jgi:hydrogenase expression/formation protein HypC
VKILNIEGNNATVDYGGLQKSISIALMEDSIQPGDFVVVHAGCAIQKIDSEEANETLALMQEMLDFQE